LVTGQFCRLPTRRAVPNGPLAAGN